MEQWACFQHIHQCIGYMLIGLLCSTTQQPKHTPTELVISDGWQAGIHRGAAATTIATATATTADADHVHRIFVFTTAASIATTTATAHAMAMGAARIVGQQSRGDQARCSMEVDAERCKINMKKGDDEKD